MLKEYLESIKDLTPEKNETKPELEDFKRTIADYLSYEVGLILKNQTPPK
ncbi:hypothetical protein E5P78_07210 [Helicobacter pylori]|nr:hypothetical protein E5P78_07210 [Helicobacter pylori]WQX50051.1 hypothetical protein E5P58_07195 [Helicobacter pylori]